MRKTMPIWLSLMLLYAACAPASRSTMSRETEVPNTATLVRSSTIAKSTPMAIIDPRVLLAGKTPSSMLSLPRTQDAEVVLSEGFYETEFKSYCLQPGTPAPSAGDAYLQAPLGGERRDIVETVLRRSLDKPELDQKNIQLLLWSVVSGSDYNRLSSPVKSTARELLTSKQIFVLQGGMMGVVRQISQVIPIPELSKAYGEMRSLFDLGNSSYEAYEQIAVLRHPAVTVKPGGDRDQWNLQEGGYYVRYYPASYQRVKVQVYVPEGILDSTGRHNGSYLLFDPVTTMAIPASTNAQRLGIGAPVADVIRKVIVVEKTVPAPRKDPGIRKFPKAVGHL